MQNMVVKFSFLTCLQAPIDYVKEARKFLLSEAAKRELSPSEVRFQGF